MKRTEPRINMKVCLVGADDTFGSVGKIVERRRVYSSKTPRYDLVRVKWHDGRDVWMDPAKLEETY